MRINKSAARTVDILSLIATKEKPLTITEISKTLAIPKSSTFELVYTLVEKNFLEIEDENLKTLKLGLKLFEVGVSFLDKTDLHREARPLLEDMMAKSGETVFLAVEDKGELVYLDKVETSSSVRTTANLGSRNPMHCTGLGKALLAAYTNERVKEITGGGELLSKTEYTIKHYNDLVIDLDRTRKRGYAIDNRESEREVFCVAAPVYNRSAEPVAAISIASLASKMNNDRMEKFSKLVVSTALNISRRLGFVGNKLYDISC